MGLLATVDRQEHMGDDVPAPGRLTFAQGMIGCPDWREFDCSVDEELPGVLQLDSLDEAGVSFVLLDVRAIEPGFFDGLSADDLATLSALGANDRPDVGVFATLTAREDGEITANLLGPIVVDRRQGSATQLVLTGFPWSTRHTIVPAA